MSVLYETDEDKQRQREIANEVAEHWGLYPMELHRSEVLDIAFLDRKFEGGVGYGRPPLIICLAEIKDRGHRHNSRGLIFGTGWGEGYRIATNKVARAYVWHATTRKPVWLIVRFNDGFIRCARLRFPLPEPNACWAGRSKDRFTDPKALEPHAIVPWKWWNKLYDENTELL